MPHFIIDCSENILELKNPQEILAAVYNAAESTQLFGLGDIKVRIRPYQYYQLGEGKESFIHVFGNILEGRTAEQKNNLSQKIVSALKELFPSVPIISMNVRDFERAGYCNKSMV